MPTAPPEGDYSTAKVDRQAVAAGVPELLEGAGIEEQTGTAEDAYAEGRDRKKAALGGDAIIQSIKDEIAALKGEYTSQQDPKERWFDRFIAFTAGAAGRTDSTALAGGAAGFINMKGQQKAQDRAFAEKMFSVKRKLQDTQLDINEKLSIAGDAAFTLFQEKETELNRYKSNALTTSLQVEQGGVRDENTMKAQKLSDDINRYTEELKTWLNLQKITSSGKLAERFKDRAFMASIVDKMIALGEFRGESAKSFDDNMANTQERMAIAAIKDEAEKEKASQAFNQKRANYILMETGGVDAGIKILSGMVSQGQDADDMSKYGVEGGNQ